MTERAPRAQAEDMTSSRALPIALLPLLVMGGCYLGHEAPRDGGAPPGDDAAIVVPGDGGPDLCGFDPGAQLFDVIPVAGGTASIPRAIDGAGVVYGEMDLDDPAGPRAFRWDPRSGVESLDLALGLPAGTIVEVAGVSDDGTVAGTMAAGLETHAFVWTRAGGLVDLSFEEQGSTAAALAPDGSVLVNAVDRASLRVGTGLVPLGIPNGATRATIVEALDIGESAHVVGTVRFDPTVDASRAFLRSPTGGYQLLPTPGGTRSRAVAVSDDGRFAVGSATLPGSDAMRPMLWQDGELVQLPVLARPGVAWGVALDVNTRGVIVGADTGSASGDPSHAWVRIGIRKLAVDTLLATGGWHVRSARVVTEDLRILAVAEREGSTRREAVLLEPRCRPDVE